MMEGAAASRVRSRIRVAVLFFAIFSPAVTAFPHNATATCLLNTVSEGAAPREFSLPLGREKR